MLISSHLNLTYSPELIQAQRDTQALSILLGVPPAGAMG